MKGIPNNKKDSRERANVRRAAGDQQKPQPFQYYTAAELWTNEFTAQKMLEFHLDQSIDAASRNSKFIDRSADWIFKHFELTGDSRLIDFGCGPGLYTSRFARTGGRVTGLDFSEHSLAYARDLAAKHGQEIEYIHGNYLEFETDAKYDLITLIFCDLCALSPAQRRTLLGKFRGMLKPNGSVLLDVHSLNYFQRKQEGPRYEFCRRDKFWSPNDYFCFTNSFKYDEEKVLLDKYTVIEAKGQKTVYNWLQCFSPESLRSEFAENGLEITEFFANVAGDEYDESADEFAAVARRKEA